MALYIIPNVTPQLHQDPVVQDHSTLTSQPSAAIFATSSAASQAARIQNALPIIVPPIPPVVVPIIDPLADQVYFRKWLIDPTTVPMFPVSQETDTITPVAPDIAYFKKWLNDN